jgi:hypothetical protein
MSVAVTPLDLDRLSPTRRLRLAAEVASTYLRVRASMRYDDATYAVARLRAISNEGGAGSAPESSRQVAAWRLARATRKTLERLPADSRCLFSSLTLMCMLERRGIDQVLVIAVRPRPFAAHAWIEVEGEAILPAADPGYERILEL